MTNRQAEALRLADDLEIPIEGYPEATELERNAAAELRRLHAINAELVEALRYVKNSMETDQMLEGIDFGNELYVMNEALSRAEQAGKAEGRQG